MTTERIPDVKELAHYVWQLMDVDTGHLSRKQKIVDSLISFYDENPIEFEAEWADYITATSEAESDASGTTSAGNSQLRLRRPYY